MARCFGAVERPRLYCIVGAAACTGESPLEYPGVSGPAPAQPTHPAHTAAPSKPWETWNEVSSWPSLTPEPIEGDGHFLGLYRLDVRVDPDDRERYANWVAGASMPPPAP